jgi:hypothetical protein
MGDLRVRRALVDSDVSPIKLDGGHAGCSTSLKRVKHHVALVREQLDKELRQRFRVCGRMMFVGALGGQVQHIAGQHHLLTDPMGRVLREAASGAGLRPLEVSFIQFLESRCGPVADGYGYCVLVHQELG